MITFAELKKTEVIGSISQGSKPRDLASTEDGHDEAEMPRPGIVQSIFSGEFGTDVRVVVIVLVEMTAIIPNRGGKGIAHRRDHRDKGKQNAGSPNRKFMTTEKEHPISKDKQINGPAENAEEDHPHVPIRGIDPLINGRITESEDEINRVEEDDASKGENNPFPPLFEERSKRISESGEEVFHGCGGSHKQISFR